MGERGGEGGGGVKWAKAQVDPRTLDEANWAGSAGDG